LLVVGFLFVGLVLIEGCKKSEPAPSETATNSTLEREGREQAEMAVSSEPAKAIVAAVEQTTCPVMGAAINKDIFIEYKGKKVYFCCPGCEEKFKESPEKYIAKLPQFQQ
jgi:YHS domain-containing protein